MDLPTLQTKLLGLIKSTYEVADEDEAYIKAIAQSEHLRMVREIVLWWRAFGVGRFCPLTSMLLKQRALFDEAITEFVRKRSISPFVEKLGSTFLEDMSQHRDTLVALLARFELALIKVKRGDPAEYIVDWNCDPNAVLRSVLNAESFDFEAARGLFRTTVSRHLPEMFAVLPLPS